eukprot:m.53581 g.53581  ORF g.53581 m.53581 type:complete len:104 (-) comp11372_c0_seq1:1928-2239(-)
MAAALTAAQGVSSASSSTETKFEHRLQITLPFPSERLCRIAQQTLSVDKEPKPDSCRRTMSIDGTKLLITFEATELRVLRIASNWFLDMALLCCETMEAFDAE